MKHKWIRVLALALVVLAGVLVALLQTSERSENLTPQNEKNETLDLDIQENRSSYAKSPIAETQRISQTHYEEVQEGLETIFEGLKEMGAIKEVPTAIKTLSNAMASGDLDVIRRAFHEVTYGRFAQMDESIPAMKMHLDSTTPYVRYLAAEALLRVGDLSGTEVLIELLSSEKPVLHEGTDLRLQSARILGNHAISEAYPALLDLYQNTEDGSIINALAHIKTSAPEQLVEAIKAKRSPGFVALNLGLIDAAGEKAFLEETFRNPAVPNIYMEQTKAAAAWALARMTGEEVYINFLSESANPAIQSDASQGLTYDESTEAIKYLGSVQSPQAVEVLEAALESQNPVAVQYATVNLLFNQSNVSEKAEQFILAELRGSPTIMGTDLTMQIASKSSNPEIREAAEAYARRTGSDRWRYWGKERSDWPIENWVYDYVFALNR
jgi:hypothetical protein